MAAAQRIDLDDLEATRSLAARLATLLQGGDVITLAGPLGAGKSEMARAVIQTLAGARIDVPSPTFTLVQDYPLAGLTLRHIDLYRIEDPDELFELGLDRPEPSDVWLLEWPERASDRLPPDRLDIVLDQGKEDSARIASLHAGPSWSSRLGRLVRG